MNFYIHQTRLLIFTSLLVCCFLQAWMESDGDFPFQIWKRNFPRYQKTWRKPCVLQGLVRFFGTYCLVKL